MMKKTRYTKMPPPPKNNKFKIRDPITLILGGSGMLLPAAYELHAQGYHVAIAARHASKLTPPDDGSSSRWIMIDTNWTNPDHYIKACRDALISFTITSLIVWIHRPYRDSIMVKLDQLLPSTCRIIRLWGSSNGDPRRIAAQAPLPSSANICEVYLGAHRRSAGYSWLTHEEISHGAIEALLGSMTELTIGTIE